MAETIRLVTTVPQEVVRAVEGRYLDAQHYDRVVARDANIIKPDGSLLLAFRRTAIPSATARLAFPALLRAARPTARRVVAAGGAKMFLSNVMGYLDGKPTVFTRDDRAGWRDAQPMFRAMSAVFERECPGQYAILRSAALNVGPAGVIPGTSFTTVTVNRNARMAVHRDRGNLPGGLGALTVIEAGEYSGGLLVFPRFRVAVDLRSCDVLIADTHESHGNTAIVGVGGAYERVSVVCYVHAGMLSQAWTGDGSSIRWPPR